MSDIYILVDGEIKKFSNSQRRDNRGRWSSGGRRAGGIQTGQLSTRAHLQTTGRVGGTGDSQFTHSGYPIASAAARNKEAKRIRQAARNIYEGQSQAPVLFRPGS